MDVTVESSPTIEIPSNPIARNEWRKTGILPSAESAPESEPKVEKPAAETRPAPEAEDAPTKPKRSNAESRIKELLAENKRLKEAAKPAETKEAAPSPAKPEVQYTRPKPTQTDQVDGKPKYAIYDDYIEDLADWKAEQRIAADRREQERLTQQREIEDKLKDAKSRYPDLETVIRPTSDKIFNDKEVSPAIKRMLDDSPVLVDVLYVMGSDEAEFSDFLRLSKVDPSAAVRKLVLMEHFVKEELEGKSKAPQVVGKPKVPSTPEPPTELGGRQTPPPDEAASALERMKSDPKAFANYRSAKNREEIAARKGR